MQHHWKKFEKLIDGLDESKVNAFLENSGQSITGSLKKKKEHIKDKNYNWIIEATDEDMKQAYPDAK